MNRHCGEKYQHGTEKKTNGSPETEVLSTHTDPQLNPENETASDFPIVGIGASAGGLAAFEQFFTALPPDTGMAFVVVQHLSPPHKSILTEILQRFTTMPSPR
jgi:two-component system, chemotaxis family, CheB/CheR fusion protein